MIRTRFADLALRFGQVPQPSVDGHQEAICADGRAGSTKHRVSFQPDPPSAGAAKKIITDGTKPNNDLKTPGPRQPREKAKPAPPKTEPTNIHHIPPRHPKKYVLKRVKVRHHRAYHMLFGASGSLEECIEILRRDWWPTSSK